MSNNNFGQIKLELEQVIDNVQEIVDSHASCIASDEQYEDPEIWWSVPLLRELNEALENMDSNA